MLKMLSIGMIYQDSYYEYWWLFLWYEFLNMDIRNHWDLVGKLQGRKREKIKWEGKKKPGHGLV